MLQIPVAQLAHSQAVAHRAPFLRGVFAARHGGEFLPGEIAGLVRRQGAVLAQDEASRTVFAVPVLNHIGFRPRRSGPNTEPPQFAVPFKEVRPAIGVEGFDDPPCKF
jgi:hypothetical protein